MTDTNTIYVFGTIPGDVSNPEATEPFNEFVRILLQDPHKPAYDQCSLQHILWGLESDNAGLNYTHIFGYGIGTTHLDIALSYVTRIVHTVFGERAAAAILVNKPAEVTQWINRIYNSLQAVEWGYRI